MLSHLQQCMYAGAHVLENIKFVTLLSFWSRCFIIVCCAECIFIMATGNTKSVRVKNDEEKRQKIMMADKLPLMASNMKYNAQTLIETKATCCKCLISTLYLK